MPITQHLCVHDEHRRETDEQIAKKRSVDKRGAKSDEAYVREMLGEMAGARNIVVINDEAHHAWREAGYAGVTGITKRLLDHRRNPEERKDRRFFSCQLEAIETLIRLVVDPWVGGFHNNRSTRG